MADDNAWIMYGNWDQYDCSCGCGNCSTCDPICGEDGLRCPEGKCLDESKKTDKSLNLGIQDHLGFYREWSV